MLQQTTVKIWCWCLLYFSSDFKLKYWSGTSRSPLMLGHINYMIFLIILTAYKNQMCIVIARNIHRMFINQNPKKNKQYLTKLHQVTLLLEHPGILIKTVIVKFRIFCFCNVLLYNRQKRDTGSKIHTDQRYTETTISRKTFMLDNIRMVENGHNTNYVEQFLWYWDILLKSNGILCFFMTQIWFHSLNLFQEIWAALSGDISVTVGTVIKIHRGISGSC